MEKDKYKNFYEKIFIKVTQREEASPSFSRELSVFIKRFRLEDKKILEIGSGKGQLQDVVLDYTGLDVAHSLKLFYHKPFFVVEDEKDYPFEDNAFDAIFSNAVFEHIPDVDKALSEMVRALKPGGVILFNMAWQVRPWARGAYHARLYRELSFSEKLIKFSILWRNNILFRLSYIIPKRVLRTIRFVLNPRSMRKLDYKKLKPNYEIFYDSDSDACNHVDPHAMVLWFFANNCEVLNYKSLSSAFFVRTGSLIIKKKG